jgi:RNA polymerase sigma-70 factor (ECF subfamily)
LSSERSPEEQTDWRLFRHELGEALERLPERQRVAVVLFDVEGYSHGEIAELLKIPEGTVRSDVFHARRTLRQSLSAFREEPE